MELDGRQLVELEDVTRRYKHPSIIDIKVGLRTWYAGAEQSYIERCKLKDAATTQAALGYKVCGMQVEKHDLPNLDLCCRNLLWQSPLALK